MESTSTSLQLIKSYIIPSNRFSLLHILNSGADPGFGQGGAPGPEAESCQRSEVESHE